MQFISSSVECKYKRDQFTVHNAQVIKNETAESIQVAETSRDAAPRRLTATDFACRRRRGSRTKSESGVRGWVRCVWHRRPRLIAREQLAPSPSSNNCPFFLPGSVYYACRRAIYHRTSRFAYGFRASAISVRNSSHAIQNAYRVWRFLTWGADEWRFDKPQNSIWISGMISPTCSPAILRLEMCHFARRRAQLAALSSYYRLYLLLK